MLGNIFGLDKYKEENRRYFSYTVKDNNNLQVLQNKLNKLLLNADYNTPTADLLQQTDSLSIHQMVAYQTAVSTYKIIKSGKPSYIAAKMNLRHTNLNTRQGVDIVQHPRYTLNIAREGFIYRGATIYNKLDECLRNETKLQRFKDGVREWVKTNITIRPKPTFQSILAGRHSNHPPPPPEPPPPPQPPPRQGTITRYFMQVDKSQPIMTRKPSTRSQSHRMKSIQHYFPPANPSQPAVPIPCVQLSTAAVTTHPMFPQPIGQAVDDQTL